MEQMTVFDIINTNDTWIDRVRSVLEELIKDYSLPENSLQLIESGDGYLLQVWEPEFPLNKLKPKGTTTNIIIFKRDKTKVRAGYMTFSFDQNIYKKIDYLPTCVLDPELSDAGQKKLCFKEEDIELILPYIKDIVIKRCENYSSGAKTFGCCSHSNQCFETRKCMHQNKLYATSCMQYWTLHMNIMTK